METIEVQINIPKQEKHPLTEEEVSNIVKRVIKSMKKHMKSNNDPDGDDPDDDDLSTDDNDSEKD